MILRDYIKGLRKLVKEHPEAALFEIVYAIDEEGNDFSHVYFGGTLGCFDKNDFTDEESIKELIKDGSEPSDYPINAVCIN